MAHSDPAHELCPNPVLCPPWPHSCSTQRTDFSEKRKENWPTHVGKRFSCSNYTPVILLHPLAANIGLVFPSNICQTEFLSPCHINPHSKRNDLDKVLTVNKIAQSFSNSSKKSPSNYRGECKCTFGESGSGPRWPQTQNRAVFFKLANSLCNRCRVGDTWNHLIQAMPPTVEHENIPKVKHQFLHPFIQQTFIDNYMQMVVLGVTDTNTRICTYIHTYILQFLPSWSLQSNGEHNLKKKITQETISRVTKERILS